MLLYRLTIANLKMIVRNRQALFWALAFPVVMLGIFGVIGGFRSSTVTVGVVNYANDALSNRLIDSLDDVPEFEVELWVVGEAAEEAAREAVRDGDLGYLLVIPEGLESMAQSGPPVSLTLVYDEGLLGGSVVVEIERFLDRINLELAGASTRLKLRKEGALSEDLSFIEFLLPGLALWGIMSNSIIGLAASMATYREKEDPEEDKSVAAEAEDVLRGAGVGLSGDIAGSSDCDPGAWRDRVPRADRRQLPDNRCAHTGVQHRLFEPGIHCGSVLEDGGGGERVRQRDRLAACDVLRGVLPAGDAARLSV